jgi:Ca2+/H+ antiporter, TMEM165/GDT1 family
MNLKFSVTVADKTKIMKKLWIKKGVIFLFIFIAAVLVFGLVVMGLWNAILPAVLGVKAITFIQALGILLLSKILFGSFSGGGRRWSGGLAWREKMKQRWDNMTPDEREKFKGGWKNRCGDSRDSFGKTDTATMTAE